MQSTITITPNSNIKDNSVVDESLITKRTYDSDEKFFDVCCFKTMDKKTRRSNLMNISLYDDILILEGVEYRILHMLSKPNDSTCATQC